MSEILETDKEWQWIEKPDEKFLERIDRIRNSMMSEKATMYLSQTDFTFRQNIIDSHHIFVNPDIAPNKETKMVSELLGCSRSHAMTLKKVFRIIFQRAKTINREFKKEMVAQKFWDFAQEAEKEGNRDEAAGYYKEYYMLLGLQKVENKQKAPRTLHPPTFSDDVTIIEIQEAEIVNE